MLYLLTRTQAEVGKQLGNNFDELDELGAR